MTRLLERLELGIGVALLAVITVLVFVASIMRFAGYPLIWSVDLAQLLFIWLCFLGATRAMRKRVHLGVDYLVGLLPRKGRLWIETVLALIFIAFLTALAFEGYKLTLLNKERLFGDSGLSYAWVTIAVPVGSVLLSCAIAGNLWQAWRATGEAAPLVYTLPYPADAETPREM